MLIHWRPSSSCSAIHAADLLIQGRVLADSAVSAALAEPAASLAGEIAAHQLPLEPVLRHLTALSAQLDNNRELARLALTKAVGAERANRLASAFAGRIADIEAAFARAVPDATEALQLRAQPLREQWEARGPGLLATLGRLTEPGLLVEEAAIVPVHPSAGGGGATHIPCNSVRIEAVLTNPLPQLPEVVRLGWLLSQLNLDLPASTDLIGRDRAEAVGPLALLPPALAAAEEVELARLDPPTLTLALTHWCGQSPEAAATTVAQLLPWWDTYQAGRPVWAVALGALERMNSG